MSDPSTFLQNDRFHQELIIPPGGITGQNAPFKVTYADYGHRSSDTSAAPAKVLLWFPPLLASRLGGIARHDRAIQYGIRIIAIDRPGVGGTMSVEDSVRIETVREITAAVLNHLDIKHVNLGAHSGGAVYALDFALHHPELLDRETSWLFLGAPWILPKHTTSTSMATIQKLSAGVIGYTHVFARMGVNLGLAVGSTIGMSSTLFSHFWRSQSSPSSSLSDPSTGVHTIDISHTSAQSHDASHGGRDDCDERGDDGDDLDEILPDAEFANQLWPAIIRRIYDEGARGISAEATLLLQKKSPERGWADWVDYDTLIPRLQDALRAHDRKLRVHIFYAEKDWMIGAAETMGPKWFDECWKKVESTFIHHESETVLGADHDTVWHCEWGAAHSMYRMLSRVETD